MTEKEENLELSNDSQEIDQAEEGQDKVENTESSDQVAFSVSNDDVSHETESDEEMPKWAKKFMDEQDKKRKDDFFSFEQRINQYGQGYSQYQGQQINPNFNEDEETKKVREIMGRMRQEEEQKKYYEEDQIKINRLATAVEEARKNIPDFDEKVYKNTEFNNIFMLSPALQERAKSSSVGVDLLNYLATEGKSELDKIRKLNPYEQLAEYGKIEAKLEMNKATKQVTNAPKPIEPEKGSGKILNLKKDQNKYSDEELDKMFKKDHKPNRR